MKVFSVTFFPIYGLTFGVNYIDDTLAGVETESNKETHTIQLLLGFFGFNFSWFTDIE